MVDYIDSCYNGKRCILCDRELPEGIISYKTPRNRHPNSNRCRQHQPRIHNMIINPMFKYCFEAFPISGSSLIYHEDQEFACVEGISGRFIKIPTHMLVKQGTQSNIRKIEEKENIDSITYIPGLSYTRRLLSKYVIYFDSINLKLHIIIYKRFLHEPLFKVTGFILHGFTICVEHYTAPTSSITLLSQNDYVNNTREPLNIRGNFDGENDVLFNYYLKKVGSRHPGKFNLGGIASIIPSYDIKLTIEMRNTPFVLSMLDGSEFEVRDYWLNFDWLNLLFEQNPQPTDGSDDILKDIRDDKDELYCVVFTDDEPCGTEVTSDNFHIYCPLALKKPKGVTFMILYR